MCINQHSIHELTRITGTFISLFGIILTNNTDMISHVQVEPVCSVIFLIQEILTKNCHFQTM